MENNEAAVVTPEVTNDGGVQEQEDEVVKLSKAEFETLNKTLGSLKRELKDLKKAKDEPKETPQNPEGNTLLEKTFLRAAQITDEEEVELALTTAKKWGISVDKLVDDEDFKEKLEKHRTQKANALATSNIRGDKNGTSAKETPAYYIAKGVPPTAEQVPDRKQRAKIVRAMMADTKNGKKFYND